MKFFDDFTRVLFLLAALGILQFFVKYWIETQNYSLYSTGTGLAFFILVAYVLFKEIS